MSVTPSEGGYDLRFGHVNAGDFKMVKEVTVRITSSTGKPYRVFQRITQPMATSSGTELPAGQFRMYQRIGSNHQGTLLYTEETPVNSLETLLYTSNATGSSDAFRLVYTITPKPDQSPGSYYGRIAFVLMPVDSTESQVVAQLNVSAVLVAGSAPAADIKTSTGQHRIVIDSRKMISGPNAAMKDFPQISFRIPNTSGTRYRIFQTLEGVGITSGGGEDFDLGLIRCQVSGARQGTATPASPLSGAARRQLLYTSDNIGSPDQFTVTYVPDKGLKMLKADTYRGKLDLVMETEGRDGPVVSILDTVDLMVDVAPMFDIAVYSGGREGLSLMFGDVNFKTGPKTSETEVYVETNKGMPYQIVQKVSGPMANEEGDKVPAENFRQWVVLDASAARPKSYLEKKTPVKEGDTILYSSGPDGGSAHFKVNYELEMTPDSRGGHYKNQISYSLVEQ